MIDKRKVQILNCDDWQALYIDGKLVLENHSLSIADVLVKLGFHVSGHWEDGDLDEYGNRAPETWQW